MFRRRSATWEGARFQRSVACGRRLPGDDQRQTPNDSPDFGGDRGDREEGDRHGHPPRLERPAAPVLLLLLVHRTAPTLLHNLFHARSSFSTAADADRFESLRRRGCRYNRGIDERRRAFPARHLEPSGRRRAGTVSECPRNPGRPRKPFFLLVIALLSGAACRKGTAVAVAVATRHDITIPVLCDGTLEPGPGSERRAPEPASVEQVLVRDGSRVAAGEVLVRLSAPDLERQAREARAEADALAAERASAAADVASLETEASRRTRAADSDERLIRSGAVTAETRDSDAAAAADARSRLTAARARLSALAPDDPRSRLSLARRSADELESRVALLTVTAPAGGIVFDLPRKAGERIEAGQVVAAVADPAHRRIRARVDEPDLPKIASGQELTATFDGLPGREWRGVVDGVSSTLRDEAGRRVGDVTGTLADPGALLPGNASINLSIVTASRRNAVVVPRSALGRDGEHRYVFVLDHSRARRREVSVGLLGATEAEITSGISAGDRVLLPGSTALSDGARVSVDGSS